MFSGITIVMSYPIWRAKYEKPIPVLPLVASTIRIPLRRSPRRSLSARM
jgi:hypothetical protein